MRYAVAIENIEEMRRREGIEDVELRKEIRGLEVGDHVKLTLLPSAQSGAGETVQVRITSIRGRTFRGKLATLPSSLRLSSLRLGSILSFTAGHIHSLVKGQPTHEH